MGRYANCGIPQEGILSYPNGEELLEEAVRLGADVIGAIPTLNLRVNMALSRCIKTFSPPESTTD